MWADPDDCRPLHVVSLPSNSVPLLLRPLAAYAGLAPTPWRSGTIDREQGISKAGNPRLRHMRDVDDELELARLHNRQVGGLLAFEDAAGIDTH